MKALAYILVLSSVALLAPQSNAESILPGTPLSGGSFGTIEISDGLTVLPGPIQEGDLILRENPLGGDTSSNWSDAVRLFNFLGFGVAFHIPDGETGIASLLVADEFNNAILPNALSPNNVLVNEI